MSSQCSSSLQSRLLFSVPRDSAEYVEAKRLLKFLDYFLGVGCENIPQNSILREFVGGSCFRVYARNHAPRLCRCRWEHEHLLDSSKKHMVE